MSRFRILLTLLLSIALAAPLYGQDEEKEGADRFKTKRTPTMREAVYTKLSEAQELAEAEDFAGAEKILKDIGDMRNLNSYENAQMFNFYAYIYAARDDYKGAIRAYEQLLAQPDLPEAMENNTTYNLAQLYLSEERYQDAIRLFQKWFSLVNNPQPIAYVMYAQAFLQIEDYESMIRPLTTAIEINRSNGQLPVENWLLLLRTAYFELGRYEDVLAVMEELIRLYPKKDYWLLLSGVYGELGQETKQLITLDLAYRQGMLDRGREYLSLGSLLMQAGIPYRGAKVIQEGLDKDLIDADARNLRLLSQAYMLAQEFEDAIGPLRRAAELSDDGELYNHLANSYMNLERFDDAADAARAALDKGGLTRPDQVNILLGMALFNADKLDAARRAFVAAQRDNRSARMANQWMAYIEKELERRAQLEAVM